LILFVFLAQADQLAALASSATWRIPGIFDAIFQPVRRAARRHV